ncbi:MAG: hypothetical protein FWD06_01970 [Oscillospiraceae bacterium]|nr:hypothetical protein [Oscillospiraceae bacterium]
MKRNVLLRTAAALLVVCVATLCLLPSTLARYTGAIPTTNVTVRAGRFHVIANNVNFTPANIETIGTTVNFGNLLQPGTWGNELNVSPTNGTIIAPGTGGRFEFTFSNQSEVPVRFSFVGAAPSTVSGTDASPNLLQFATSQAGPWHDGLAGLHTVLNTIVGNTHILQPTQTSLDLNPTPIRIYWQWPFNRGNLAANVVHPDTELGRAAALNPLTPPRFEVIIQFQAQQLEA